MDWLRNTSLIGSRPQPRALVSTEEEECDPTACYDSFKEHWLQAFKIIQRSQTCPSHDDVLGVVNHLEQMVTLLLYDIKRIDQVTLTVAASSQSLDYLLRENVLEKILDWGRKTGKYSNAVKLEQLKLYEVLVSQSRQLLLVHQPFLRPMLNVLRSCQDEVFPRDIEKSLVSLLYHLCVLLMQNIDLLDLFFVREEDSCKFIIFSLLINYVHREDATGMQARDALLLCMSLSKKNKTVGSFITDQSNMCVLLTYGLCGLYSRLPHVLNDIVAPDWHRLTPDDVNDIKDLLTFVTSLEFCNAVAQVAHPLVQQQLQEFIYKGFLIPVVGPALLQSSVEEKVAATAYFELILRTVSNPGLLYPLVQFLLQQQYDGHLLLNILVQRISSNDQLCLVTLALFETLVDLNCEDLMLELVFKHLQPCLHLMLSQRCKMLPLDPHCYSFEKFLLLAPSCCEKPISPRLDGKQIHWNQYGMQQSLYGNYHAYLCDARNKIASCQIACLDWSNSYTGCDSGLTSETTLTDEAPNSLLSLGASSGYESLKVKTDDTNDESILTPPVWQISQANTNENANIKLNGNCDTTEQLNVPATSGLFLSTVLDKLNNMLSNSLYINLHLTGLISRMAVYAQPLLRTYLLDHSLVLQPDVPSLFQIIGSLKLQIDEYLNRYGDSPNLVIQARQFLLERETRMVNARRNAIDRRGSITSTASEPPEPFQRNGAKRRSFTNSLSTFSTMFGRRSSHAELSLQLVPQRDAATVQGFVHPKFNEGQHVALCAVVLDEWVKELAALAQEHTIAQLATILK